MGLLGKADATLAQMSYNEAIADVAPDLKEIYQAEVLNQALFQKGVEDHFNTLYADNNLLADQLKEATTLAMADLGTDYEGMELFNNYLNSMKERMKALPKGKKGDFERAKIRGELVQLKKSTDGMEATLETLGTMIEAGDFDKDATGKVNLSLLNAIASGDAKKEIVNGKLFYSISNPVPGGDDIKIDQQMLKDMLIQKDPEFQSNFNKIHVGENALGKVKGNEFDRQGSVNKYEASFPSKAAFATNIHNKQGSLKYSFAESLMGKDGSESIYKALMDMGQTTITKYDQAGGTDGGPDGKITAADFANVDNGIILVESLTDIHSDHFDYQTAKKVAAEFYADNISAKEFKDGANMRVGDSDGGFTQQQLLDLQREQEKSRSKQANIARINNAIIKKEFGAINDENRSVVLNAEGTHYVLAGMKGSTKLDMQMIPIDAHDVDQRLMNHFIQGDDYVSYVSQEQIDKQLSGQYQQVTDRKAMLELGNVTKVKHRHNPDMVSYMAGSYTALDEANTRLAETKKAGFEDAFIFATLDGKRITMKKAKELLLMMDSPQHDNYDPGNIEYTVQIANMKKGKDINLEMTETEKLINKYGS